MSFDSWLRRDVKTKPDNLYCREHTDAELVEQFDRLRGDYSEEFLTVLLMMAKRFLILHYKNEMEALTRKAQDLENEIEKLKAERGGAK